MHNQKMQFRDLQKQYQMLKEEIDNSVLEVLASGAYIMGKQVRELESKLAEYVGVKHCLGCANGTDALTLALKAWGIQAGDAVFVPDFTFFASAEVISLEAATPIFVDVDKDTFNIDVQSLGNAIEEVLKEGKLKPKVILTVDLFGLPADYPKIRKIADKYGLYILEDAAQGFGGRIGEQKACSFGDISTTSFFPAKPLGCYGDGGAVFTDNDDWAALMDSLRVHGKGSYKYDNVRIGLNSRLDTLQAAILLPKFKAFVKYELDNINKAAALYTEKLKDIVKTPEVLSPYYSSWAQYTLTLQSKEQRDALQSYLKEANIPTMIYYPKALHQQSAYAHLSYPESANPVTKMLSNTVLSLPIHPYISEEEIERVLERIVEFFQG